VKSAPPRAITDLNNQKIALAVGMWIVAGPNTARPGTAPETDANPSNHRVRLPALTAGDRLNLAPGKHQSERETGRVDHDSGPNSGSPAVIEGAAGYTPSKF
jgi:hypothetical protein